MRAAILGCVLLALIGCASAEKTAAPAGAPVEIIMYQVQPGDSLSRIASRFNTTATELRRLNPNANPDRLQIGQFLRVSNRVQSPK